MFRLMLSLLAAVCLSALRPVPLQADVPKFPGAVSDWHGFTAHNFEIAGRPVIVVSPPTAALGRPWVWHGEFFGHKPEPDIALLQQGFHLVALKIPDMLGCPQAVQDWNQCYAELTGKYGFHRKPALVGLSRGGLYCYNWAIANPDKVACIYADAPVCDFKSWPGGKGAGPGSAKDWQLVLQCYGFENEQQALEYRGNPVDNLAPLAKAGVPLLHVIGDADEVVPWQENTGLVAERYRALGGQIEVIVKPGVKHHPHGLTDSTPIVQFIAQHAGGQTQTQAESQSASPPLFQTVEAQLVQPRTGLGNFFQKLKSGKDVKIAYLGGSITAANGWRVKSREYFARQFPDCKVEEIHAAIGGTGSDLGVFRVQHDALQYNPDLMFVEFSVNDGGAQPEQIWKAMEGIVRQAWAHDPRLDLCFVYTFAVGQESALRTGECPRAASAMELLAEHYGIPSVNFALRVVEMEQAGKLIFKSDMPTPAGVIRFSQDGVHPLDEGHQIYQDVLAEAWPSIEAAGPPLDHQQKLDRPFVADHWQAAKMVPIRQSMLTGNWQQLPDDTGLGKSFSKRLGTLWQANTPGDSLKFRYRGTLVKLYDLVGPDGGQAIIQIDGQARPKPVPRFDSYCTYHRLSTLFLDQSSNPNEEHSIVVQVHPEQPDRHPVAFRLKDPETELKSPKYQGTHLWVGQILVIGDVLPDAGESKNR